MKRIIILLYFFGVVLHIFAADSEKKAKTKEIKIDTTRVGKWITQNAIPISSNELDAKDDDLNKINPVLNDKRIIGLGDATHGTKEFFTLKHRLIAYLIKNGNCSAVALELPVDLGVHLNNYVKTAEGDIDELLQQGWWWHGTEEIKDFLVWLKNYNADLPEEKKISFYGFDSQVRSDNTYQIFEYLKKVDGNYAENVLPIYEFMAEFYIDNYSSFTLYRMRKYDDAILSLKKMLETNKEEYIRKSSEEEYLLTKARVNTLAGIVEMEKNSLLYSEVRSKTNFENIKIFSEIEGDGNKLVVWAHNGHIASDEYIRQEYFNYDTTTEGFYEVNTIQRKELLGCMLRDYFGDKYFNIGFEFYEGSFMAIEFQKKIKEFVVSAPKQNTLPSLLNKSKVECNSYFIELNPDKMDENTFQYFNSQQYTHEIGAAYISRYVIKNPLKSYNAIVFIRKTSAVKM